MSKSCSPSFIRGGLARFVSLSEVLFYLARWLCLSNCRTRCSRHHWSLAHATGREMRERMREKMYVLAIASMRRSPATSVRQRMQIAITRLCDFKQKRTLGQDSYQTYARTRVERKLFSPLFSRYRPKGVLPQRCSAHF